MCVLCHIFGRYLGHATTTRTESARRRAPFVGPAARRRPASAVSVLEVPVEAYPELAKTIAKYANRDVDFADAALVWLAGETGLRRILTVDERDFGVYRLKGGKRLEVIPWMR